MKNHCEIANALDGVNRQMWADHVNTCKKCNNTMNQLETQIKSLTDRLEYNLAEAGKILEILIKIQEKLEEIKG